MINMEPYLNINPLHNNALVALSNNYSSVNKGFTSFDNLV